MTQPGMAIVAALHEELRTLVDLLRLDEAHIEDHCSMYKTRRRPGLAIYQTGMGEARVTDALERMASIGGIKQVVMIGFAGGLDPKLLPGQVYLPAQICDQSRDEIYEPTFKPKSVTFDPIKLITAAAPVFTVEDKLQLAEQTGGQLVDMESAHLARCCNKHGLPWLVMRAVSDTATHALPSAVSTLVDERGFNKTLAAVIFAMTHPWLIPSLMKLGNASRLNHAALEKQVLKILHEFNA